MRAFFNYFLRWRFRLGWFEMIEVCTIWNKATELSRILVFTEQSDRASLFCIFMKQSGIASSCCVFMKQSDIASSYLVFTGQSDRTLLWVRVTGQRDRTSPWVRVTRSQLQAYSGSRIYQTPQVRRPFWPKPVKSALFIPTLTNHIRFLIDVHPLSRRRIWIRTWLVHPFTGHFRSGLLCHACLSVSFVSRSSRSHLLPAFFAILVKLHKNCN